MREIKFRVWDNVDYMSNPFTLSDLQKGRIKFTDNCIVMQFTGLKDSNGAEIYEGDIMRYPAKNEWELTNYSCFEVFFHGGDAHIEFNIGYSMSRMHNHGSIGGGMTPSFKRKTVSKMIVIGNIHENKELLKQ